MIKHIQSPGIVRTVYSSIFKTDIGAIFSHTYRRSTKGEKGRPPLPFLKIEKSVLILERKALIVSIFDLNYQFRCSFKSI